jgi:hypothetical protein
MVKHIVGWKPKVLKKCVYVIYFVEKGEEGTFILDTWENMLVAQPCCCWVL